MCHPREAFSREVNKAHGRFCQTQGCRLTREHHGARQESYLAHSRSVHARVDTATALLLHRSIAGDAARWAIPGWHEGRASSVRRRYILSRSRRTRAIRRNRVRQPEKTVAMTWIVGCRSHEYTALSTAGVFPSGCAGRPQKPHAANGYSSKDWQIPWPQLLRASRACLSCCCCHTRAGEGSL